jgi:hypothetical protein
VPPPSILSLFYECASTSTTRPALGRIRLEAREGTARAHRRNKPRPPGISIVHERKHPAGERSHPACLAPAHARARLTTSADSGLTNR